MTTGQFEDLPGPDDVLLYVPWFFDPEVPPFASPKWLRSFAFDNNDHLGTPNVTLFEAL